MKTHFSCSKLKLFIDLFVLREWVKTKSLKYFTICNQNICTMEDTIVSTKMKVVFILWPENDKKASKDDLKIDEFCFRNKQFLSLLY